MEQAFIDRMVKADSENGKTIDFTIGKLYAMLRDDRTREEVYHLCHGAKLNFEEVWAGIEFQQAVNACIKNMGFSKNINISDTNNTPYTSTTAVSPTA